MCARRRARERASCRQRSAPLAKESDSIGRRLPSRETQPYDDPMLARARKLAELSRKPLGPGPAAQASTPTSPSPWATAGRPTNEAGAMPSVMEALRGQHAIASLWGRGIRPATDGEGFWKGMGRAWEPGGSELWAPSLAAFGMPRYA